jgi:murein DD-endopeptidase MepM/ murein hydrolase activator NlpD
MKSVTGKWILALTFLVLVVTSLQIMIRQRAGASVLKTESCESADFRAQHLSPALYEELKKLSMEKESSFSDLLTVTMLNGKFFPDWAAQDASSYIKYKQKEYELLRSAYAAVWEDLEYFPVAGEQFFFEDGFGDPREYGGSRSHEGCDIFGSVSRAGYYPVVSMTDGVVEKIGWLPLGGYRIGIRSPHGGYFYYAHLSGYEKKFQEGESIEAGDILGYMGNTGYGTEGTKGKFPVHLHLGIYIRTPQTEELSVDPYWILRCIYKNIRNYSY